MNNLSQIKKRVNSILHIKKLSKIIKSLAIKKSRMINSRLDGLRIYFTQLEKVIETSLEGRITTFVESDNDETLNIVFFSDISFSGSLNSKIKDILSKYNQQTNRYIVIGKKNPLNNYSEFQISHHYSDIENEDDLVLAFDKILDKIVSLYYENKLSKVNILTSFLEDEIFTISTKHIPFIPLGLIPSARKEYLEVEPNEKDFLNVIVHEYLKTSLYYYYYCSKASEYAISLKTAENIEQNARELLEELNHKYHQVRKQRITDELSNVASLSEL